MSTEQFDPRLPWRTGSILRRDGTCTIRDAKGHIIVPYVRVEYAQWIVAAANATAAAPRYTWRKVKQPGTLYIHDETPGCERHGCVPVEPEARPSPDEIKRRHEAPPLEGDKLNRRY